MSLEIFDYPAEIQQFQPERPISQLMLMIWQGRMDLQKAFDLNTASGQEAFINWYEVFVNRPVSSPPGPQGVNAWLVKLGRRCLPEGVRTKARGLWYRMMAQSAQAANQAAQATQKAVRYDGEPGASLIGYAHAELGMGEHVRMSAASLAQTDVPFGVVDFGAGTASRQKATLDHGVLIDTNKYRANIFHVNADQVLSAYAHLGRKFFERRYNISYPFWELAKFPAEWVQPLRLMDEVWAPTTYIQRGLNEALGKEVLYMPTSAVLPKVPQLGREHFGIPVDQYTFFFAFDCYSFIDRKNPYAVVAAFKKAFPLGNEKAGLIMKAMNAKETSETWQRLVHEIGDDKRIRLINETMDKLELLSFKAECDCYVSLHRAEGLGLGPLESMLLGKPVILTNYSGSADYATGDNSCLVDYSLIPVQEGQYIFHEGQVWADPDVGHAAWHMKRLAEDPALGIALGKKAAAYVAEKYAPARCGQLYKQRLQELGML